MGFAAQTTEPQDCRRGMDRRDKETLGDRYERHSLTRLQNEVGEQRYVPSFLSDSAAPLS